MEATCIGMVPPFSRANWTKHNKDISIKACQVAIVMGKPID